MGWEGIKNGELLARAAVEFDALVTDFLQLRLPPFAYCLRPATVSSLAIARVRRDRYLCREILHLPHRHNRRSAQLHDFPHPPLAAYFVLDLKKRV